jgi:phosphoribosylformylglycinamidine synthase PurS subunit
MIARVFVTLKPGVLDPQGRAIARALVSDGFGEVQDARVGKLIEVKLDETDPARAQERLKAMCEKLLANTVIERYEIELLKA